MASETLTRGVLPRVQWGPVIAGVLCALAVQIVLGLCGVAFGFASAPAGGGPKVLAAIWAVLITPVAASFVGALVAVRIAGERLDAGAYLHGALVWCIGLIAGAIFLSGLASSGAMSAGAAAGNMTLRSDMLMGGAQVRDDTAKSAALGTSAAAVGALLGLGGALLGAAVGKQMLTGEPIVRRRRGSRELPHREYRTGEGGAAYPPPPQAPGAGETPLHHH